MSLPANNFSADSLSRRRTIALILYNVALTVILSAALYHEVVSAADAETRWEKEAAKTPLTATTPSINSTTPPEATTSAAAPVVPDSSPAPAVMASPASDTNAPASPSTENTAIETSNDPGTTIQAAQPQQTGDRRMISFVLFAITLAGALGGALSNLRGVFEFTRENSGAFPAYLELPFYLRPVSGMLCGLFTFFVSTFFAGALASSDGAGWRTLEGMFPYVGIAFIAGFAAQEFMERLRDTARTLFGNGPAAAPVVTPLPTDPASGQTSGNESFTQPESGLESVGGERGLRTPTPPPPPAPPVVTVPQKRAD